MREASDYQEIFPGIFRWEFFSKEHKVELTSHAVRVARRLYIFDPVPLRTVALNSLVARGLPTAIVLTDDNHERAAGDWRERLHIPIWADYAANLELPRVYRFGPRLRQWLDWEVYRIPGGSIGEVGLFNRPQSLFILGDAVTNLPGWGFNVLTEKYCAHQPTLRHSLKQLCLTLPFDKLLLAHGTPILKNAVQMLESILAEAPPGRPKA